MLCNFEMEDYLWKTDWKGCGREGSCQYFQASGQMERNNEAQQSPQLL